LVDIGISVVAANIDDEIVKRFTKSLQVDAEPQVSYKITFVRENAYSEFKGEKFFNRNKAHNCGIRELMDVSEVILCADVDFLTGPGALDKTFEIARSQPFFGIARFLKEGAKISPRRWNEWMKIKEHKAGYGGWVAMRPHEWKIIGGWNETLFSWGYDKHIYQRVVNAGLIPRRSGEIPLIHVHHKRRNKDIRKIDTKVIESLSWESYL